MVTKQDTNQPLRKEVKMLGNILGEILIYQGGQELFDTVEKIRTMCKSLRLHVEDETYRTLKKEIERLNPEMRMQVIKAFSVYFHLINAAEQNHRIRRKREYQLNNSNEQPGSIEQAIQSMKENHITGEIIHDVLERISLELIITAHPTEAAKRSILEIQKRLSVLLKKLNNPLLTESEYKEIEEELYSEITTLWHSDELRDRKPKVMDEVRNGLYYFDKIFFDVLPEIHQEVEDRLTEHYSDVKWSVPNFLRFGSWIGGDRDGNPFVTPDVTWETLKRHRTLVLRKYEKSLIDLMKRLSHSTARIKVNNEVMSSIEYGEKNYITEDKKWPVKNEAYRRKLAIMVERVRMVAKDERGYQTSEELLEDLLMLQRSVDTHHPKKN